MQIMKIGGIMVAEIMYAKWWKTSATRELKGLTKKLYPSALRLMKPYLHAKFEVYRCYGYWVSLLQPDPQEEEEEEEEEEEHGQFVKITFTNIAYIVHQITSDFWQDLILMVIFTLMLIDIDWNWNWKWKLEIP